MAARGLAITALAVTSVVAGSSGVQAQDDSHAKGPDPTASSIRASSGPFRTQSSTVSSFAASGFGGGRIYAPTDTSQGTFGAVVIAPGFTAGSTSYASLAARVASHGFVAFAIDTNSRMDFPPSRGRQILAALDYLTQQSPVRDRIDSSRLAVSGHSMGGGGTLEAANSRSTLKAAVPLQPWHSTKSWSRIQVPTMIIGAQNDTIASTRSHAVPFYQSLNNSIEKAYVELRGASHMAAATNGADQGAAMVSWLKRFVDDDTRYNQFLCPPPSGSGYSGWRDSCPIDGGNGGTTPTTAPPEEECSWWQWWC